MPLIRQAKGTVVFIASIGGRVASPFLSPYNTSQVRDRGAGRVAAPRAAALGDRRGRSSSRARSTPRSGARAPRPAARADSTRCRTTPAASTASRSPASARCSTRPPAAASRRRRSPRSIHKAIASDNPSHRYLVGHRRQDRRPPQGDAPRPHLPEARRAADQDADRRAGQVTLDPRRRRPRGELRVEPLLDPARRAERRRSRRRRCIRSRRLDRGVGRRPGESAADADPLGARPRRSRSKRQAEPAEGEHVDRLRDRVADGLDLLGADAARARRGRPRLPPRKACSRAIVSSRSGLPRRKFSARAVSVNGKSSARAASAAAATRSTASLDLVERAVVAVVVLDRAARRRRPPPRWRSPWRRPPARGRSRSRGRPRPAGPSPRSTAATCAAISSSVTVPSGRPR